MSVSYSLPIGRARERMQDVLFRPFNLGTWFVLGWTAFLADMFDGGGGGGNFGSEISDILDKGDGGAGARLFDFPAEHPEIVALIVPLVVLALVVGIVLFWVGARGQFMFLDNLVHRRTEVAAPWREYKDQGNSLFAWTLAFGILVGLGILVLGFFGYGVWRGLAPVEGAGGARLALAITAGMLAFVAVVVLMYVSFFLGHVIVPIMHHRRCSCSQAWSVFGRFFRADPWPFVVYGLLVLGLAIAALCLVLVAGLGTLCIGFILMMIPYIGTVVTLPVPVFFRALDLEWLVQFGPELYAFPLPAAPSGEVEGDGAVVGPEDLGPDAGGPEPRPEDA
ncbi:MAG TPA: hypothetical protein PLQ13_02720 [Candidatus Krumholzibacteria bacterium]|nr:hypothetical protein [Candidatus Krumholzibacteria bacterium]